MKWCICKGLTAAEPTKSFNICSVQRDLDLMYFSINILVVVLYFRYSPSVVLAVNSTAAGEQRTLSLGTVRKEANVSLACEPGQLSGKIVF